MADTFDVDPDTVARAATHFATINTQIRDAKEAMDEVGKTANWAFSQLEQKATSIKNTVGGIPTGIFAQDVAALKKTSSLLGNIANKTTKVKDDNFLISDALEKAGRARAKFAEYAIIDPKETKAGLNAVKDLEKQLYALGVPVQKVVEHRKKAKQLLDAEVLDMNKLTPSAKKRVKAEVDALSARKQFVQVGGQLVAIGANEVQTRKRVVSAFGRQTKGAAKYASSMAGVQLSLAGIIALIVELYNFTNKIGALSKQVAAQWGAAPGNLKLANKHISQMYSGFRKTLDVAGAYVKQLTQAGFEQEHVKNLAAEIMAIEQVRGISTQEQVGNIKGLVANYDLTGRKANDYLMTIQETAKTIPMLSMSEATDDVKELIDKTKVYNVDLLGTLGLYNSLMRTELAEKLGLGDAPRVVRKDIVGTITGMSKDLAIGWKAALGDGATAAAKVLEFEKLLPEEKFVRLAERIPQLINIQGGAATELRLREVLTQLNFSTEAGKVLAEAMIKKGPQEFIKAATSLETDRKAVEEAKAKAIEGRDALIQRGLDVAWGLEDALSKLKRWIIANLVEPFNKLRAAINKLADILDIGPEKPPALEALEESSKKYTKKMGKSLTEGLGEGYGEVYRKFGKHILRPGAMDPRFTKYREAAEGAIPFKDRPLGPGGLPTTTFGGGLRKGGVEVEAMRQFVSAAKEAAPTKKAFQEAMINMRKGMVTDTLDQMVKWIGDDNRTRRVVKRRPSSRYTKTGSKTGSAPAK